MANNEPMTDERLAEIQATLSDEEGMSDTVSGLTSAWASVRFSSQVKQAALDLMAEVERLRLREAEYEKQRADYHHVMSELVRGNREHDALLHENDALRSKLAGADQRAATYSNELVMALDAGKRVREERDGLLAENAAMRAFVQDVAGDHEHAWDAVDPQDVWYCTKCNVVSHDYALDVQTRARFLAQSDEGQA